MLNFFAIIGGMGTLATQSFVCTLNKATAASKDQDFLNYLVFNDASIPDRTAYITDNSQDNPLPVLAQDVQQATDMGASFIVMACNTAHYFYPQLQELTTVPILHMPELAIDWTKEHYDPSTYPRIGFMGTEGTKKAGIYRNLANKAGYQLVEPEQLVQDRINTLIYEEVKSGKPSRLHYEDVIQELLTDYNCDTVLLGCTELSVLNETFPLPQLPIIDAQAITIAQTVQLAKAQQGK
ncbi:aspartate/glutamate racemase family protein [Bombiscardovia coagulans]|uniref:Aspartate racemase n=1 Tax=Bombiscardovia coagulans TaxID=686666 RepID=A0A261EP61_9BIFI|nr:amino acid racemase [Bombiscardovia coagulans]OZG48645.1 aspartate racemase [Bombiscardovia coagulans]